MPDIPDEFVDDARQGEFPAEDFMDWLADADDETRDYIDDALDNGMSLEWAVMAADADISSDPAGWDGATIIRDTDGDWYVSIIQDGEAHTFKFDDDDTAVDLIWADLYFHLVDAGVDFDKDIDSPSKGEAAA